MIASLVVVGPWVGFNASRFKDRTFVSTNDGIALAGSNCDNVYYGDGIGLTSITGPDACIDNPPPPGDQSQVEAVYRKRAFALHAHAPAAGSRSSWPRAIGRTWSLYRPLDMVAFNKGEGREAWVTRLGLVVYYPTLIGAIAGASCMWRRRARRALWVLLVPAIAVTVGVAVTYGQTRFRAAAEPSLAILAAVAAVVLYGYLRVRRAAGRARDPRDGCNHRVGLVAAQPLVTVQTLRHRVQVDLRRDTRGRRIERRRGDGVAGGRASRGLREAGLVDAGPIDRVARLRPRRLDAREPLRRDRAGRRVDDQRHFGAVRTGLPDDVAGEGAAGTAASRPRWAGGTSTVAGRAWAASRTSCVDPLLALVEGARGGLRRRAPGADDDRRARPRKRRIAGWSESGSHARRLPHGLSRFGARRHHRMVDSGGLVTCARPKRSA